MNSWVNIHIILVLFFLSFSLLYTYTSARVTHICTLSIDCTGRKSEKILSIRKTSCLFTLFVVVYDYFLSLQIVMDRMKNGD
jgi:hypothetical protein